MNEPITIGVKNSTKIKKILSPRELQALSAFQKRLRKTGRANICRVVLFGSRARMEGDENSDVDVLVLLKKEDYRLKIQIWDAAHAVFAETEIMISPLVLSERQFGALASHERLIAKVIQKEGIQL